MCQVIHSAVGYIHCLLLFEKGSYDLYRVWYPTIQFTCKVYDSKTGEQIWKSINVNNFVTPPPGLDKRSSKADEYSIIHKSNPDKPDFPESYSITANLGPDVQISLELRRYGSAQGFKLGKGPKGGYSYFGTDQGKPDMSCIGSGLVCLLRDIMSITERHA